MISPAPSTTAVQPGQEQAFPEVWHMMLAPDAQPGEWQDGRASNSGRLGELGTTETGPLRSTAHSLLVVAAHSSSPVSTAGAPFAHGVLPQGIRRPPSLGGGLDGTSAFSPVQGLVNSGPVPPCSLLSGHANGSAALPPRLDLSCETSAPFPVERRPPKGQTVDPSIGFKTWGEQMLSRIQGGGPAPPGPHQNGNGGLEKWEVPIFKPVASCPHAFPPTATPPSRTAPPPWAFRDSSSPISSSLNSTPRQGGASGSSTPVGTHSSNSQLNNDFAHRLLAPGMVPGCRTAGPCEASPGRQTAAGGMVSGRRASLGGAESTDNQMQMPQSVLKIVARALQADLTIAAILQRPTRLAETVLCVPEGLVTVPVRFSKGVLDAATGQVVDTGKLLLPSMLTAALGARPQKLLASQFSATGCEGLCYAMWVKPESVPNNAAELMADTVEALPGFLAGRVQAMSTERLSRRFDAILKRMPQGVVFIDDGLGPCLVNPAAADLLNLPTFGELDPVKVAATMHELAARSDMRAEVYRWFNAVAGNPNEIIESDWVLKNPRQVLRVRSYPVGGQNNQLMSLGIESLVPEKQKATHGRVWLFDDVTAERDARDAIEAADRAKSQFLAMMSHELRTPLTGVLGMLDLLRLTPVSSEQGRYLRAMQGSAESLLTIINDILDFSKIEAGHLTLEQIDFHLGALVEQVAALFQGKLEEKKLKLSLDLPPSEEMAVNGDPIRLRQVFANLVSNAIKFTEVGGISVSIRRVGTAQGTRGLKRDRSGVSRSATPSPLGSTPNLSQAGNPRVSGTPRVASSSRHAPQNDFSANSSPPPATSHDSIPPNSSNPGTQPPVAEPLRRSSGGIAHPRRQSSPSPRQNARFPPEALQIPADSGEIAMEQGQRAKLPRTSLMGRRIPGLTVELTESSASEPSPNSDGRAGITTPEDVASGGGLKEGNPPEVGASSNGSLSGVRFEQGAGMPRQRSPPRREKSRLSKVNRSVSESDFVPESSTQGRRVFSDPGSEKTAGLRFADLQGAMLEPVSGRAETALEKGAEAAGDYDPQEREAGLGPRRLEVLDIEGNETKHSPAEESRPRSRAGGDVTLQGGRISRRGSLGALGGATGLSRRGSVSPLEEHEGRIWLEIRVTDSGIGLTKEQQGKLFSAFIQADCTTTRRFGGTGLGLAICKRLVNAMGGDIWVTSEMGAGSTFAFTVGLRVAEDPVGVLAREGKTAWARSSTPPIERVTKSSKQCKILVAEDNPINQLLIRKMLKHYGHETQIVGNGQLAVDEIKNKPFHYSLILMDLQMPVLDGLGATKAIRALGPPGELPIFALTADVLVGAGFELEENGLDGYLTKPINWEILSSVIENASYQGGPTEEQAA